MMDYIKITGLRIFANHGVLPEEKKQGQDFYINARLFYDMKKAANTDQLEYALNYADCCAFMTEIFTEKVYDLIETAAQVLCTQLLLHYEVLQKVELELCKPHAPIGLPFENVSVNMERSWHTAIVAVGSNMGDKRGYIEEGIRKLSVHERIRNVKASSLIETKPYGPVEQDVFLNGCLKLQTLLEPEELLVLLHEIEAEADRKRELHWGPRTLDMDIIFYDKLIYESDTLLIPHVDMQNRDFVLAPLAEIEPNYRHPILGLSVVQMLDALQMKNGEDK